MYIFMLLIPVFGIFAIEPIMEEKVKSTDTIYEYYIKEQRRITQQEEAISKFKNDPIYQRIIHNRTEKPIIWIPGYPQVEMPDHHTPKKDGTFRVPRSVKEIPPHEDDPPEVREYNPYNKPNGRNNPEDKN